MKRVRRQLPRPVFRLFADRGSGAGLRGSSSRLGRSLTCALLVFAAVVASATFGVAAASAGVVNVTLAGAGTGTVTSTPAGVNCSNTPGDEQTDCNVDLGPSVYQVKLHASADSSFVFRGWSGTAGGTCGSGSENPCLTGFLFMPGAVTATFGPPPDPPAAATDSASAIGPFSAKLHGQVNPGGNAVTDCYFEIGTTTDYGQKVACQPPSLGTGSSDVAVNAGAGTLKAATTYHYRLVAKNVGGANFGADQTFTTSASEPDSCPNAAARAQQAAQALPQCMAYEMLSPSTKYSQGVDVTDLDPFGDTMLMGSGGGFADSPTVTGLFNTYEAARKPAGWTTLPRNLPAEFVRPSAPKDNLPDLSRVLMLSATDADLDNDAYRFQFSDADGTFRPASPPFRIITEAGLAGTVVEYISGSRDLSRFVVETVNTKILPGYDPVAAAGKNFYEVVDAGTDHMSIRRVDLDDAGVVVGPLCAGRGLGGQNTSRLSRGTNLMSADGRVIFFTAFAQAAPTAACTASARGRLRVLARIDGERTVEVSQSRCTRVADAGAVPPVTACNAAADVLFEGASSDGQIVYFITTQQLTNDDTDTNSDLYEYRFADGEDAATLRRVTTAADGAPDAVANVQGVLAMSVEEGRPFRVYFAARGRITTAANELGQQPSAAGNNLYLYERSADGTSSRIVFVTTLSSGDAGLWGAFGRPSDVADDGRVLILPSPARLTADDTDDATDLYRYDASSSALRRVSTAELGSDGGNGNFPVIQGAYKGFGADGTVSTGLRGISADGSVVVFGTREALSPRDINGTDDVYRWRDGVVSLVTDGQGPEAGIVSIKPNFGVSHDGRSVVFSTQQRLLPADGDGVTDVYAARVDGGFLDTTVAPEECHDDDCQGATSPPPPIPRLGGSVDFVGPGNPVVPKPVRPSVSVKKLKAVTGTAATLKVRVPGAGRISVSGTSVRTSRRSATKAGTYSVKIALRARAKSSLKKRKKLSVRVRVAYRAADRRSASQTMLVRFKQPNTPERSKKGGQR
jgi:hypothetical protein